MISRLGAILPTRSWCVPPLPPENRTPTPTTATAPHPREATSAAGARPAVAILPMISLLSIGARQPGKSVPLPGLPQSAVPAHNQYAFSWIGPSSSGTCFPPRSRRHNRWASCQPRKEEAFHASTTIYDFWLRSSSFEYLVPLPVSSSANPLSV